jgi:uncharacterized protein YgiM (DUF1202 family)
MNPISDPHVRVGRVIKDYLTAYPEPLTALKGESLTIVKKDGEWPGWAWCLKDNGRGGWVPEKYIKAIGDQGFMICDYDAAELSVSIGELVTILKEESGWFWCRNKDGKDGWVPIKHISSA